MGARAGVMGGGGRAGHRAQDAAPKGRDSSEFLHSASVLFFLGQAGKTVSVIPHHMGLS